MSSKTIQITPAAFAKIQKLVEQNKALVAQNKALKGAAAKAAASGASGAGKPKPAKAPAAKRAREEDEDEEGPRVITARGVSV